jgi:hypothetical protein
MGPYLLTLEKCLVEMTSCVRLMLALRRAYFGFAGRGVSFLVCSYLVEGKSVKVRPERIIALMLVVQLTNRTNNRLTIKNSEPLPKLAGTVAAVHRNRYAVNQLRCWRGKENGGSR